MMVPQPRLSFGALALVVSLALPVGVLSLVARSTTGEQVDAADLIVVGRVASLQFIDAPPRTAVELVVDHAVAGRMTSERIILQLDGRAALAAGDSIVALLGLDPTELLGTYQVRKNPSTLEDEVVTDVTGMLAQGVRGGSPDDPIALELLEAGMRVRKGLAALPAGAAGYGMGGQMAASAPQGVTVLPDAFEPNDDLASRTDVTGLHPPTLVTGNPLVLSGLTLTLGDVDFFSFDAVAYSLIHAATLPGTTGLPTPDTYMGLFDATLPGALLTTDDDSGPGTLSKFAYLFEQDGPYAVAVESAPDVANLFDGSTGTTQGHYALSLEFKLGSFMANALDALIGVSPDGTFIEDFVGYKTIGGDDALFSGVPADAWALDFDARPPSGVTHIYGGSGEQLTDPLFLDAVAPLTFELGPFQDSAGLNRRGFAKASAMVLQTDSPQRGVTVTHTYTMSLFSKTLKGDLGLQIATDDAVNDLLFTRVMDVDLYDDGNDTFHWSFDPNSPVKAFAVDTATNVGNVVVPALAAAREPDVDRQIAIVIDDGDTPANMFGETNHYKLGFTHIEGFANATLALQEAVRRLRLEAGADAWVVAIDQDPVSGLYGAFGAGVGD
jgi:hypothetical protein